MAALSGEQTLAELSSEFGVHPTMISTWKQELIRRASCLRVAARRRRATMPRRRSTICTAGSASCRLNAIFLPGSLPSPDCREAGDDYAERRAARKPAMQPARHYAQQLLLPGWSGVGGCARSSEPARPDFHRASRCMAAGGCGWRCCRRGFRWGAGVSGG